LFYSSNQPSCVDFIKAKFGCLIGALLQALYGFFSHSPKKFLEFQSLCDVLTKKGNKLMKNMKTRWINMLFLVKHVMEQYQPLENMHDDVSKNNITNENINLIMTWS
jgi:hypothetical protein